MMSQLPESFLRQTESLLGAAQTRALAEALAAEPPVSVRLNLLKGAGEPEGCMPVPWCSAGRYLPERPSFTFDPFFHAGYYYVQEAASMFVEQAFRVMEEVPRRVLDLCAAPGGKSTLWRTLLPEGSLLVCNEPVRRRFEILAENMSKWGHPDVVVTNAFPVEFASLSGFFDVVAADVPCSGEGMFRKDHGAIGEWSAGSVEMCAARQMQIIRDVWPALREGGWLVYSTCTFNRAENEDNIRRICCELGAETVPVPVVPEWGVTGDVTGSGLSVARFLPHRTRSEGFFLALLRKTAPAAACKEKKKRRSDREPSPQGSAVAGGWLRRPEEFVLYAPQDGQVAAVRRSLAEDVRRLQKTARCLVAGIPLAGLKGRKLVPRHELALSIELAPGAFPVVELSREEAVAYLRQEAFPLSPDVPRGYVVAAYRGARLGFFNNLGTRANNLYPAEWRIRSRADRYRDLSENIQISES